MNTIRAIFVSKSRLFLEFTNKARKGSSHFPNCAPVSVTGYASISLNMAKYLWKCLNKLFWLYRESEYAWSSYMFGRLLKMPGVLNKSGFWWYGCICKGYVEIRICFIMAPYSSIMLEHASICLNVPQYVWTWLNITECHSICLKMHK